MQNIISHRQAVGRQRNMRQAVRRQRNMKRKPQPITLKEYYKKKGIEVNTTFEKNVAQRADINVEWIKEEKLTLIETKEDKKNRERNAQNLQQRKPEEKRENKDEYKGTGKKKKVVIQEEDFPSL